VVSVSIDVGLRGGQPDGPRLLVRSVAPVQLLVCANPDYLARHGTPARWEDLARHRLTAYRKSTTGLLMPWQRRLPSGEVVYDHLPAAFTVNTVAAEVQAVLAGVGIGQLAGFSAAAHVRSACCFPRPSPHSTSSTCTGCAATACPRVCAWPSSFWPNAWWATPTWR
jgi:DNA-binding transcriptional LysR family regulator